MAEEMKDAEFKEFLAQIRAETPDMGKLKAGMEKFGMGYFTDSQKEAILKEIFPSPTPTKTPKDERLGFQDMTGIRNTLKAMQEMHRDGKIDDTKMTAFLTMTNPETGNNIMTTIAIQTRATEFKRGRATDPNSVKKLDDNLKIAADIQETLGEVKYHVLNTAINTPDSAKRPIKYADFADIAQKKKSIVFDTIKSVQAQRQLFPVVVPKKETELVKVEELERGLAKVEDKERGLAETKTPQTAMTVNGAQKLQFGNLKDKPLDVDGTSTGETPVEPDSQDKTAHVNGDAGPDPKEGRKEHPGGIANVREQDIIDYMFQSWFLGGVNLALDTAYKVLDRGLDALCSNYDNAPRSSVAATLGGGAARGGSAAPAGGGMAAQSGESMSGQNTTPQPASYASQLDSLINQGTAPYLDFIEKLSGPSAKLYVDALLNNIDKNIGKEPSQWQCDEITLPSGEKITPLRPTAQNSAFIQVLNEMKLKNPQAFDKLLNTLRENPQAMAKHFNLTQIRLASTIAVLDYAANHPGVKLEGNDEAQRKIGKNIFVNALDLLQTEAQINKNEKQEYCVRNGKKEPLSQEEMKNIHTKAEEKMSEYLNGILASSYKLTAALVNHHNEPNDENKKKLDAAKKAFEDARQYPPKDEEKERDNTGRNASGQLLGPINLKEAATQQNQFDAVVKLFNNTNANDAAALAGQQAELFASRQNLVEKRNQIIGNNSPQQVAQRTARQNWSQAIYGMKQERNGK